MPATLQDIKDFFALSGNNPAVTDAQLLRVQAWLDNVTRKTGTNGDDLVDYIYQTLRQQVVSFERNQTNITF